MRRGMVLVWVALSGLGAACGAKTGQADGGGGAGGAGGGLGGGGGGATEVAAKVYVANSGADTVTVLDAASLTVTTTLKVGGAPSAVAVDDPHHRAYVANGADATLSIIDTSKDEVLGTLPTGAGPAGVAVDPSTQRVYVTNASANSVTVLDAATGTQVGTVAVGASPVGLALHPRVGRLYVANVKGGSVSVIDTATLQVRATLSAGTLPFGVAADPATSSVYVSDRASNQVSVIDVTTDTVTQTVVVGLLPAGLAVSPFDDRLYVANSGGNTLSVLDAYFTTAALLPGQGGPEAVAVDPRGTFAFLANRTGNSVTRVNPAALSATTTSVAVGPTPAALAVAVPGRATPPLTSAANLGVRWTAHPASVDRGPLTAVASDGARFVAVGAGGRVRTSSEALVWTPQDAGTRSDLAAVASMRGQWVAVGAGGAVLASPDGVQWAQLDAGTSARLAGLAEGDAGLLLVGAGVAVSSSDGTVWAPHPTPSTFNAVAFGAGRWVAVGDGALVASSSDGASWAVNAAASATATLHPGTASALPADLHSVVWTGSQFVATGGRLDGVSGASVTVTLRSPDGLTWTGAFNTASLTGKTTLANGQLFTALPESFAFLTSTDASAWTLTRNHPILPVAQAFPAVQVAFAAGRYVAVASNGSVGESTDGKSWAHLTTGTSGVIGSVTATADGFWGNVSGGLELLSTVDGTRQRLTSPVGLVSPTMFEAGTWSGGPLRLLGGRAVVPGNQGRVAVSTDGYTWTETFVPGLTTNGQLTAATYGKGLYVVVGLYETIATSPDAQTWTVRHRLDDAVPTNNVVLNDVFFIDDRFYAVGQGGRLVVSDDGLSWTVIAPRAANTNVDPTPHAPSDFLGLARGNGVWVLAGVNRAKGVTQEAGDLFYPSVLTSTDGVTWVERVDSAEGKASGLLVPGVVGLGPVLYAEGAFHLLCRSRAGTFQGAVFSSTDGARWVDRTPPGLPAFNFEGIAARPGQLLLVGGSSNGSLVLSSP